MDELQEQFKKALNERRAGAGGITVTKAVI